MTLLPREAIFMLARGLMPGLGEMLVAASSAPAVHNQYALSGNGQIGDGFSGLIVKGQRADRNLQNHVLTGVTRAVGAFAVTAAIGLEFAIVAVAQQRVVVQIGFQI